MESPLSRDPLSVGSNNDGVQQAKIGDVRGEPFNVAHVAAVAVAKDDGGDRHRADAVRMAMRASRPRFFSYSFRADLAANLIDTRGWRFSCNRNGV